MSGLQVVDPLPAAAALASRGLWRRHLGRGPHRGVLLWPPLLSGRHSWPERGRWEMGEGADTRWGGQKRGGGTEVKEGMAGHGVAST
jgi:hypothetical protein